MVGTSWALHRSGKRARVSQSAPHVELGRWSWRLLDARTTASSTAATRNESMEENPSRQAGRAGRHTGERQAARQLEVRHQLSRVERARVAPPPAPLPPWQ